MIQLLINSKLCSTKYGIQVYAGHVSFPKPLHAIIIIMISFGLIKMIFSQRDPRSCKQRILLVEWTDIERHVFDVVEVGIVS